MRLVGVLAVLFALTAGGAAARSNAPGVGVPIAATAGQQFSGPVATFVSPNTPPGTPAAISWGDQTASAGTVTGTPAQYTVSGSHTYSQPGTYQVQVTFGSDSASTTATVAPGAAPPPTTAPAPTPPPPASKPTATVTASSPSVPAGSVLTLDASKSTGDGLHFSFDLTGNGTSETACDATSKAEVIFPTAGSHTLTATVTDTRGATSTTKVTVDVTPGSPPTGSKPTPGDRPVITGCGLELAAPAPCIKSVTFGIAEARNDCFKEDDVEYEVRKGKVRTTLVDPTFHAKGTTRLNGIDLVAPAGVSITIDQKKRQLTSTGAVSVELHAPFIGTVTLKNEKLLWTLPKAGAGTFHLTDIPIGSSASLLGLDLAGDGSIDLTDGATTVGAWIGLPAPISVTAGITLRADNDAGLHFDKLHIEIANFWLGPLEVQEAVLDYNAGAAHWLGIAKLFFPGAGSIRLEIDIADGVVEGLVGDYDAPPPGLPLGSSIFFQHAGVAYYGSPQRFSGSLDLTAGPSFFGHSVAAIKGSVDISLASPWWFRVSGDLKIVDVPFASAYFQYNSTGIAEFGGHVGGSLLGIASFNGDIGGFYQNTTKWNIEGDVNACIKKVGCTGGGVGLSSKGVAVCVYTFIADVGFAYRWSGSFKPYITGCGVEWIRVTETRALATSLPGASTQVTIPAGLPYALVRVQGTSGVPNVVAHGPGGRVVTGSAVPDVLDKTHDPDYEILNMSDFNASYLVIAHPQAGAWTIDPQPGSPPVSFVDVGRGLPKPSVHATVLGTGRERTLSWTLKPLPGQSVDFWEESTQHAGQQLASTTAAKGSVRFSPADGPAGTRRIVAVINGDGSPRKKIVVATYAAPAPAVPARPTGLAAVRRGRTLVVSWRGASTRGFDVRVRTSDRRSLAYATTGRRVSVARISPTTRATVTVTAVARDGRRGPAARLAVKARR